jgi:nucleoside-diphosphate-sugar epimerase
VPVIHIEPPRPQLPIERRNFVADPRRFTGITGWQPTVDLPDGLDRTIRVALAAPAAVA